MNDAIFVRDDSPATKFFGTKTCCHCGHEKRYHDTRPVPPRLFDHRMCQGRHGLNKPCKCRGYEEADY